MSDREQELQVNQTEMKQPKSIDSMATNIADMGKAIIASQKEHWDEQSKKDRLKGLCKAIRKCDGSVNAEVREWIEEVGMTTPHTINIKNGTVKI